MFGNTFQIVEVGNSICIIKFQEEIEEDFLSKSQIKWLRII